MNSDYVELRGTGYYIKGTRVSLDSVVYGYLDGEAPAVIQQNFPSLTVEQVYGSIAYYLEHRAAIDEYLKASEAEFEAARQAQKIPDELRQRLERSR